METTIHQRPSHPPKRAQREFLRIASGMLGAVVLLCPASAQLVLFDFDNAPIHTPLPIDQTVSGITAHFSATGDGYSIQDANTLGFTPSGFAGNIIYPSSINLSDLLVSFDQPISAFAIMYACQELGCDDAATMRVTAYMNGSLVGTSTRTATFPGTWPVDTLNCSFPQGFNSVVVHYDSHPPTCQDYGVIFVADNMRVTPLNSTAMEDHTVLLDGTIFPNPVAGAGTITLTLAHPSTLRVWIQDIQGRMVKELFAGTWGAGEHRLNWNVNEGQLHSGVYLLLVRGEHADRSFRLVVQ